MTIGELDYIFPFVVFSYGLLITLATSWTGLERVAHQKFSIELWERLKAKRTLGLICFFVGGLWSLQNIWLG